MSENTLTKANPAPLGLVGFGMTTMLLNIHNLGLTTLSLSIVAMGLAMGGLAQIIAGIMEFKNGNTFGTTAFTAYGLFWWSLIVIWVDPFHGVIAPADHLGLAFYFLLWGLFTLLLFIATLKQTTMNKVVFSTLTLLFFILAAAQVFEVHALHTAAGAVGVLCGLSAFYNGLAQVINETYGKTILPL